MSIIFDPMRGKNADFQPVSKFNNGSSPLRGILPVITFRPATTINQGHKNI